MIALGSSFAAGPGIEPLADRAAGRSKRNYPHLVAGRLGARLVDATVSGATTSTILSGAQRGRSRFAPQIQSVTADATLVTITAGGNDLGYLRGILLTALAGLLLAPRLLRPVASRVRARVAVEVPSRATAAKATAGLALVVDAVHAAAPSARVLLVDYLPIITADTTPETTRFSLSEIAVFRETAATLTRALEEAGRTGGAEVVTARTYSAEHGLGAAEQWVRGLQPLARLGSSFHPTEQGMTEVARAVLEHLHGPR